MTMKCVNCDHAKEHHETIKSKTGNDGIIHEDFIDVNVCRVFGIDSDKHCNCEGYVE